MDYSAPASSVHGILQARILAWEDPFFRGIFWTQKSNPSILLCRGVLYHLSHHGIPSMVLVLGFLKIFFIKQRTFSTTLRLLRVFIMKSVQSVSSVTQSCLTLCDPIDCSIPGLPVHHQLLGFTQTHVYRVGDATQSSLPL